MCSIRIKAMTEQLIASKSFHVSCQPPIMWILQFYMSSYHLLHIKSAPYTPLSICAENWPRRIACFVALSTTRLRSEGCVTQPDGWEIGKSCRGPLCAVAFVIRTRCYLIFNFVDFISEKLMLGITIARRNTETPS